jgi:hypothetical protein
MLLAQKLTTSPLLLNETGKIRCEEPNIIAGDP